MKTRRSSSKKGARSRQKNEKVPYVFPYVRFHGRHYPLIPITVRFRDKKVKTFGLLDSGASVSVFRPEIAKALGIKFKKKNDLRLGTAMGGVVIQTAKARIQVKNSRFSTTLGFAGGNAPSFNLIGRQGFFNRFSVCFNEIMKTVILLPVDKYRQ